VYVLARALAGASEIVRYDAYEAGEEKGSDAY